MMASEQASSFTDDAAALGELLGKLDRTRRQTKLYREYHETYEQGNVITQGGFDDGHGGMMSRIVGGGPYPWQVKFHNLGRKFDQRALLANNQGGKSRTCGAEVACHVIGWYPKWWKGYRAKGPVEVLVSGVTNEELRNICQRQLLGDIGEDREPSGTGWIPKERIGKVTYRQCGVPNVVDTVKVTSDLGGESLIIFKSYEQGAAKFQGVQFDIAWLDEEPEDQTIFPEIQTRMMVRQGILLFSRTPLYGMTDMVRHFMEGGHGTTHINVGMDDCPHITKQDKEKMLSRWPEHERETRAQGKPMLGAGAVYPVPDEWIHCEPFSIPPHYRRLVGIDFGIDHPFVAVWIAYDADSDVIYVTDLYEQKGATPPEHATAIKSRGRWLPVSWPHDGAIRDKGSGVALAEQYREHDLNMLHVSARYDDDRAGAQPTEPVLQDILERMRTGRFKVFNHLERWFAQKRMYHRKDGRVVRVNDDIMAATNYAVMMRRYAATPAEENATRQTRARFDHDVYDGFSATARA